MNTKGEIMAYIRGSIEFVKELQQREENAKVHADIVESMLNKILNEVEKLSQ